jgi:uncharacterized protein (TIGR02231 family)
MKLKPQSVGVRSLLGSLLFVLSLGVPLAAAPVESAITAVTVYGDRAVVTRSVPYHVDQPGTVEVVVDRLPTMLLDESLQVAASGSAQATLLDVTPRTTQVDFAPDERVRTLEDAIRDLKKQDTALDDRKGILRAQSTSLNSIEHASTESPTKDTPRLNLDDAAKLLAFLEEQRGKISSEERSIGDQREDLGAKRRAAELQLAELRQSAGNRSFKTVTIRFIATTAGTLDLRLSYAVRGASWVPSYDVRATSADSSVSMGYFGTVRQSTGEDWNGVNLTLSTARPSSGGAPEPLNGWYVDVYQPQEAETRVARDEAVTLTPFEVAGGRNSFTGNVAAPTLGVFDKGSFEAKADFMKAHLESQLTSASFEIPVAATVPSDNSPQKVPISTITLSATPEYLAVPKQVLAAYLTDKVTNTSDFPLIAGPMNVFLDGTLVASSRIDTVMPGEKFDLALGVDEGISLKRKLNSRYTDDKGIVSKKTRITYDFTITVQNNKKTEAKVTLRDQVPVSRNEKIVVTLDQPKEDDAKRETDGMLEWSLDLQPGAKRELPLKFSVEYPVDVSVTGLE